MSAKISTSGAQDVFLIAGGKGVHAKGEAYGGIEFTMTRLHSAHQTTTRPQVPVCLKVRSARTLAEILKLRAG
jgi:hypothetical protein